MYVCTSVACHLSNARRVYHALADEARAQGVDDLDLREFECLGACDAAPLVQINFANYDRATPDGIDALIDALRRGEQPPPSRGTFPGEFTKASRILAGLEPEAG